MRQLCSMCAKDKHKCKYYVLDITFCTTFELKCCGNCNYLTQQKMCSNRCLPGTLYDDEFCSNWKPKEQ